MLRLPRLDYLRPRSIEEAAELASHNAGAMFIAGGTDLVPNLKRRQFDVSALISLNGLPSTRGIEGDAERGVTIGAGATLDELARHEALVGPYRALGQACGSVSGPFSVGCGAYPCLMTAPVSASQTTMCVLADELSNPATIPMAPDDAP